jgi:hypothetical protein
VMVSVSGIGSGDYNTSLNYPGGYVIPVED